MSALTFTLKASPQQRIDLSPLTPDQLVGKSPAEIGVLPLVVGRKKLRVDSLFDISGNNVDDIIIANSCDKLDYIGHDMKHGRITVHGNAGDYLGLKLRHGEIVVHGNAGIFAASGMAGGFMHIHGNVGDFLARWQLHRHHGEMNAVADGHLEVRRARRVRRRVAVLQVRQRDEHQSVQHIVSFV